MQVTIDLAPETQSVLLEQAQARGLRLEEHLQQIVEQIGRQQVPVATAGSRATLPEFERDLDFFSEGTETLPALTAADLSREAMYADHD